MYALKNAETGDEADVLYVDGYEIGDRQLEDVVFEVRLTAQADDIIVEPRITDAQYFATLNAPYWLGAVRDAVLRGVPLSTDADADDECGEIITVAQ